ncbi:MAG: tubulin/FtsZ family protein [Dehalococcoidales bacterium]|jgi:cell division GTPase FtsZ|nr:tubulin/FtsZ family protein [Dehalococcoidales bacterium]
MKLVVIGLGQCGGRIADEFSRLNKRAASRRGIEIVTGTFAVNTDAADLSGLTSIKRDYQHRILIGGRKTGGHGVGKVNEMGAEIARADADKVIDAIRTTRHFYETDAFLLIAGAGGGTGSGSLPVMIQHVKRRYSDKPVYAAVVLPFEHEEQTEERTVYNTATCLKSTYAVADAVFLIDNQRYIRKDSSLRNNLDKINALIAEPFYGVLCAGEEKNTKHIGAKLLDAGDIMQTLVGWTVLGYGTSQLPMLRLPGDRSRDFRKKGTETQKGLQAMDAAMSELSLNCKPEDARRALYLISAPSREMNVDLIKELGDYLRGLAPQATIRNGDYPRQRGMLEISVILSELSDVEKIREYYTRSTALIPRMKKRQEDTDIRLKAIEDTSKDIPSLL